MPGAEIDNLVAQRHDNRDKNNAGNNHQPERLVTYGGEDDNGDNQHQEQKAGAAAHVGGAIRLDSADLHRHAGFKSIHGLVLGAVIGKNSFDIRHERDYFKVADEDGQTNHAFDDEKGRGVLAEQVFVNEVGQEIGGKKEQQNRQGNPHRHHRPQGFLRDFLRLLLYCHVGGIKQALDTQHHRLDEDDDAAHQGNTAEAAGGNRRQVSDVGSDIPAGTADGGDQGLTTANHHALNNRLAAVIEFFALGHIL